MNSLINVTYRKKLLKKLLKEVILHQDLILKALYEDFKKPSYEGYLTEFYYVISDIKYTLKHIDRWTKPKKVRPTILNFPSKDYIRYEPYGRVLIIAPWNYPFHLALVPLTGAIAAGNSVVLKPSELTANTSGIITKIIQNVFDVKEAVVIQGGTELTQSLLRDKWDYIFFTGSVKVGKMVAEAAAKHLTPITLELGGKNPCIVDNNIPVDIVARRIVWGKFLNAGQTCIAPDYVLVHKQEKFNLVQALKREIITAYGPNPEQSPDLARIINHNSWKRLVDLIDPEKVILGGDCNESTQYIAPTLIDEPKLSDPVMQEEIFGPILPIISYETSEELEKITKNHENPLALYVFSRDKNFISRILNKIPSGGVAVNDTIIQFVNKRLPFGGIGSSGIGAYHGITSFTTFSHQRSVSTRALWFDPKIRYAPYHNKKKLVRKIIRFLF